MNAYVTANDYNYWLANTKQGATTGVPGEWLGRASRAPWHGSASKALPKTSATDKIDVRYHVSGSNNQSGGFLNVDAFARTENGDTDTLGSFTFDVYYDGDELEYGFPLHYTHWWDDGYIIDVNDMSNEYGRFVRVQLRVDGSRFLASPGYELSQLWGERLVKLRFYPRDGPIVSHDIGFNLFSLGVGILGDGAFNFEDHPNVIPQITDVFDY